MKHLRGAWVMLAVTLAVLMPLEQAHCLWMAPKAAAESSEAAACGGSDHSCCAPTPSEPQQQDTAPSSCPCIQLPSATLPAVTMPTHIPTVQVLAILQMANLFAAAQAAPAPILALDVGSPPLPIACDAHGLRAPPLSA